MSLLANDDEALHTFYYLCSCGIAKKAIWSNSNIILIYDNDLIWKYSFILISIMKLHKNNTYFAFNFYVMSLQCKQYKQYLKSIQNDVISTNFVSV